MKTWNDIYKCWHGGTLGDQTLATLQEFSRVPPEPSDNPRYHRDYESAMASIRELIRQKEGQQSANQTAKAKIFEHPGWKVTVVVIGGVLLFLIIALLKHRFPFLN